MSDQSGLPKNCYIFAKVIKGNAKDIWVNNYSGKDVYISKDYKLGYIELPESPQYAAISVEEDSGYSSADDVVSCHFMTAPTVSPRQSQITEISSTSGTVSPSMRSQQHAVNLISKISLSSSVSVHPSQSANCPPLPICRSFVPSFLSFNSPLHRSSFFFYRRPFFFLFLPSWRSSFNIPYARQNTFSLFSAKTRLAALGRRVHLHALC